MSERVRGLYSLALSDDDACKPRCLARATIGWKSEAQKERGPPTKSSKRTRLPKRARVLSTHGLRAGSRRARE
jgi:hypothetical protein